MPEPIGPHAPPPNRIAEPRRPAAAVETTTGADFKSTLLDSLAEVSRLQQEAAKGVEQLATGETANMAEVLSAVRKADIAFSMMMEMRNKLVDAYRELQQMRV